jgi:preprotein translocase subunit SecA
LVHIRSVVGAVPKEPPLVPDIFDKILRFGEGKIRRRLDSIAATVNAIEADFEAMTDDELRAMTDEFKERLANGETLDDLMPEAFATVREAAKRVLGQRHFDVQLKGGAALHLGYVAEMRTGEGKTLVSTLPAYLNALSGNGVHVVTVNDYLAKYQSEQMGRVHHFLGLNVGVILTGMTPTERRDAYNCDITYGTNNEFGFDYLRDNMAADLDDLVQQRGLHFAIVDEVDSILIDEARTPLIISGPTTDEVRWYGEFARIAAKMINEVDYEVDETKRTVSVLESGITKTEEYLGIDNLYETENTPLISFMNNAIKAKELFRKDKEYVVIDGEVFIVDEHTGRVLAGRRYSDGLHQSIEAKEKVKVREEFQTLASITLQNFFRMYTKLSGMTGTGKTEENEFAKIYGLGVIPIDPHRPPARIDQSDLIYRTETAKFTAVVEDIALRNEVGQPVLIGTTSVEKSERLSTMLTKAGVPHSVLNAKQHESEATYVALAGHKGAVTVATNMAGRGTDIMLGGSVEFLADKALREQGLDPVENTEEYDAAWPETVERVKAQVKAEHDEVKALGGLYVIGTERHESRRIDNQLRGRSGRQGDPGESRFYLSLEDDLMRLFKSEWVERILTVLKVPDDMPIENKRVTNSIESAQKQIEAQNFDSRKNVLKYDDVMNRQRHVIYGERRLVLEGANLDEQVQGFIDDVVAAYVNTSTPGPVEDWDVDGLQAAMSALVPGLEVGPVDAETVSREVLTTDLQARAHAAYAERENLFGADTVREMERQVILSVIDQKWREHLYEMDYLREGIGLRSYAQRDPLVEYQREGYDMFSAMMDAVKEDSVRMLFHMEPVVEDEAEEPVNTALNDDLDADLDTNEAAGKVSARD